MPKTDYRPALRDVLHEQYPPEWRAGFAARFGMPFNPWAAAVILLCRRIIGAAAMDAFMTAEHGDRWRMT